MPDEPSVSVVVPVKDEKSIIRDSLRHFGALGADDLIVVDGMSRDGTGEIIRDEFPRVRYYRAEFASRAKQMNLGASQARTDVLLFAHADSRLPDKAASLVKEKICCGFEMGCFVKKYEQAGTVLKFYGMALNFIYLRLLHNMVGSNVIFVTKKLFNQVGGFPEVEIMEDIMFSNILKRKGSPGIIDAPVTVSSRRYLKNGIARHIYRNAKILFGYKYLNKSLSELSNIYYGG